MGLSLEVSHLEFAYDETKPLLADISFRVNGGETLCLLGPNGAGKTTLLRCLIGVNRTAAGTVRICGDDLSGLSRRRIAQTVALVPQGAAVTFPFSTLDMVLMGRTPHIDGFSTPSIRDEQHAHAALDRLGIAHLGRRFFNQLSSGERQLVLIARALCQEARILVMDEPAANLDYGNQVRILKVANQLRESGCIVVMSAHNPDHAFMSATHAAVMKEGRILDFGAPHAILTGQCLSDLYSTPISVVTATIPDDHGTTVRVCVPLPWQ